jgi:hypothetical protein
MFVIFSFSLAVFAVSSLLFLTFGCPDKTFTKAGFAEPMKLFTILTTILFYTLLSRATHLDDEVDDMTALDEDWDDEFGLEPVHYNLEKRGCCSKNKFSLCYGICSLSCKPPPGCPTCELCKTPHKAVTDMTCRWPKLLYEMQ